jgi:hypothetical protein
MKYFLKRILLNATTILITTLIFSSCKKTAVDAGDPGNGGGGTSTGQVMFWVASDFGCGNISVSCNGTTLQITGYNQTAPACGASNSATFTLSPGTYSYSANCSGFTWSGSIVVTDGLCNKIQFTNSGNGGGGGGVTTGQAMFWAASDFGCGNISVSCNGITRTITSYSTSGAPACGASGFASFSLSPGTYSYSASCSSYSWNGSVTVVANGCNKIQFTTSGGGGGGGGFNSMANVTFWVSSNFGCGNITVNCGGTSHTISSYYSSGSPACGASGTATFLLPAGNNYAYTASCSGLTWSGNVIPPITGDPCIKVQLIH